MASSYSHGSAASTTRSRDGVPLTNILFTRALGAAHGTDGAPVPSSSHPADTELVHPDAVREITEGMIADSVTWGPRARYLVRIQAAASELGMRLGEYEEFLARNNLAPDPHVSSARQSSRQNGGNDEYDEDGEHNDDGSQSPQTMPRVEKRDTNMSGSEGAPDGSRDLEPTSLG